MTKTMMDEDEEEALFARLRRGLESVRRDVGAAQPDATSPPSAPDPELIGAIARVEASLRALASNLESLARRTDGLEGGIEARIETTVARATAGLRAELERLSARIPIQAAPPETPRPDIVLPSAERPLGSPSLVVSPRRRRRRRGRPLLIGVVVLALVALGAAAATRLGYGLDAYPIGQEMQARWAGWRAAWFPAPASPPSADATDPAPSSTPDTPPAALPAPPPPPPSKAAAPVPFQPALPPVLSSPPSSTEQAAVPAATPTPPPPPPPPPLPQAHAALAPPLAPVTSGTPAATSDSAGGSAPTAARPSPPAPTVVLRAKAPVWVEVREKTGHVLLRRTLQTGETWTVPANPDLLLSAGNVRGLEIVVNGEAQPLPASKSGVLRDAPLDGT